MNERTHRYLDGELRREELTPDELQRIETYEGIIREMEESYESLEVPDLTARVMARLTTSPAANNAASHHFLTGIIGEYLQRTVGWLWAPRLVRLRPAYGILAVAALLLVVVLPNSSIKTSVSNPSVGPLAGKVFVQFRLDAPQASKVRLAGSFTGWEPMYTLDEITPGIWSILVPLDPGVHNYAFVVNGEQWMADPAAPKVDDGFGGVNSRLSVLLPNGPSNL